MTKDRDDSDGWLALIAFTGVAVLMIIGWLMDKFLK